MDLSTMTLEELRAKLAELVGEVNSLSEAASITPEQDERLDVACDEATEVRTEIEKRETRLRKIDGVRRADLSPGAPEFQPQRKVDPDAIDFRTATAGEVRSAALKVAERDGTFLSAAQQAHLERLITDRSGDCDGDTIAKMLLVTETDVYRSAFQKVLTGNGMLMTEEERQALRGYATFRAASEGTGSAGGYGIPVLIDPTIIISSGAADAPILGLATIKTITTDAWKGVTAPGASWTFVAEAGVVTDGTPTLVQPSIPVYKGSGFIPYSIEVGQDYPGFADEMAKVLSQGYTDLLAVKSISGTGSSEPTGVFTRMQNTTTGPAHITVTTKGTLGSVDLRAAWGAMPERFRPRSSWVMNVQVEEQIRALGNGLALSDFTVNLAADGTSVLMGKPVVLTDYAPSFTNTTGAESALVVGDFSQYYIIQRAGMTVELVDHLFDPTTGRPTGQRGWYAYSRVGADIVNTNAFRLLSNT